MTPSQRISLHAEWWPAACAAQHWDPRDRAMKLRTLGQAVGREITSSSQLNKRDDIDRVKSYLLALADDVDAAGELDHPELGRARRLRVAILEEVNRVGDHYARAIIADKCARAGIEHASFDILPMAAILASLDAIPFPNGAPSLLDQLIITLKCRHPAKEPAASAIWPPPSAISGPGAAAPYAICHLPSAISEPDPF